MSWRGLCRFESTCFDGVAGPGRHNQAAKGTFYARLCAFSRAFVLSSQKIQTNESQRLRDIQKSLAARFSMDACAHPIIRCRALMCLRGEVRLVRLPFWSVV